MVERLEQLTKSAPFRVVITHEDGSESSIACLSRESANRVYDQRRTKIGLPTIGGRPRSTGIEIREMVA